MNNLSRKSKRKELASAAEIGEMRYQQGLLMLQRGRPREAINAFGKASFFMPHKPQPFIAAAECYVSLCDFKGAVKQYRRALWLLQSNDDIEAVLSSRLSTLHLDKAFDTPNFNAGITSGSTTFTKTDDKMKESSEELTSLSMQSATQPPSLSHGTQSPLVFRARAAVNDNRTLAIAVETRLAGILDALSIVLYNVKDYVQALRFADDSLELFEHPQVMLHRCAYLIALERADEAEKALERHLKKYPGFFIESSSLLVHLYCQRQAFQHAKALIDDVPLEHRQNAQILLARHIFDVAYSFFRRRSIDQSDEQGLSRCLLVFPEDPALSYERAKYYIGKGLLKKAIPDLFRCIKISDGSHKSAVELMTETLFRLGSDYDSEDGIKKAIDYYSTSLLWYADNIPVILARGDCYTKLGDYQNALQDFLRVDRISPNHAGAKRRIAHLHDVWGVRFHAQRKLEEAEREFSQAIATCEEEPRYYYHRALCRFDMNEPRYALRDVLSCQRLNSRDPVIRDFVNGHLSFLSEESECQSSRCFELPKVPQQVSRRALILYGNDAAKVARRLNKTNEFQQEAMEREEARNAVIVKYGSGAAKRGRRPPTFTPHNFIPSLGGVLTCSKAKLSVAEVRSMSPKRGSPPLFRVGNKVSFASLR